MEGTKSPIDNVIYGDGPMAVYKAIITKEGIFIDPMVKESEGLPTPNLVLDLKTGKVIGEFDEYFRMEWYFNNSIYSWVTTSRLDTVSKKVVWERRDVLEPELYDSGVIKGKFSKNVYVFIDAITGETISEPKQLGNLVRPRHILRHDEIYTETFDGIKYTFTPVVYSGKYDTYGGHGGLPPDIDSGYGITAEREVSKKSGS